jgi:hypothetical protein
LFVDSAAIVVRPQSNPFGNDSYGFGRPDNGLFFILYTTTERMPCPQTGGHFYSLQNEGHAHARPDGDGHDQIFFKLLQLVLSLPVLFGLQVRTRVAVLLNCHPL